MLHRKPHTYESMHQAMCEQAQKGLKITISVDLPLPAPPMPYEKARAAAYDEIERKKRQKTLVQPAQTPEAGTSKGLTP